MKNTYFAVFHRTEWNIFGIHPQKVNILFFITAANIILTFYYYSIEVQLIAKFPIWPSSESRHCVIANYTSAVIFKKTYFGLVLLYNYPSECVWKQLSISYLLGANNYNFPPGPILWRYIFTRVSICSLHVFEKYFGLKCIFIKLLVSACFPKFIKTHPRKKTDLLFCFWLRDSRVIIVTSEQIFGIPFEVKVIRNWAINCTHFLLFLSLW